MRLGAAVWYMRISKGIACRFVQVRSYNYRREHRLHVHVQIRSCGRRRRENCLYVHVRSCNRHRERWLHVHVQVRSCDRRREHWLYVHSHYRHTQSSRREGIQETENLDPCDQRCHHTMQDREFSQKMRRHRLQVYDVS